MAVLIHLMRIAVGCAGGDRMVLGESGETVAGFCLYLMAQEDLFEITMLGGRS